MQDGVAYPTEIQKTAAPGRDAVQHFGALERLGLPVGPGGLICLAEQSLPLTATAQSIPAVVATWDACGPAAWRPLLRLSYLKRIVSCQA